MNTNLILIVSLTAVAMGVLFVLLGEFFSNNKKVVNVLTMLTIITIVSYIIFLWVMILS